MVAVKTTFDGQMIQVPQELRGARPGEVLIVFEEQRLQVPAFSRPSIWDFCGKAEKPRSAQEINEQIRAERDSWDAR